MSIMNTCIYKQLLLGFVKPFVWVTSGKLANEINAVDIFLSGKLTLESSVSLV